MYLKGYGTMGELLSGLTQYFAFYNGHRMHQALQYKTPDEVYASASGGGALIVDKFPRPPVEVPVSLRCTGPSTGSQAKTGAAPSSCESNRVQLKLGEKLS